MKKPFDLTGKVYIVTGSGKGIGKGIVRCFVKSGAKCCINCNSNAAMAEETLKEIQAIGGEDCAFVYQADVSDPEQAKAIVDSGCELMNHSNAHDHYNSLTAEQIIKTVLKQMVK